MSDKIYPGGLNVTTRTAAQIVSDDMYLMGTSDAPTASAVAYDAKYSSLRDAISLELPTRRNLLINAQFAVNQRGYISGTNTSTNNEYTFDRWRISLSGKAITYAYSEGKRTVTIPAPNGTAWGLEQVIEGTWVQSGNYVISWEGTAQCTVNSTARTNGETFELTGGSNVTVRFSLGTVANPQLERGTIPTPFDWRPTYVDEWDCLYYTQVVGNGLFGYFPNATSVRFPHVLRRPMRTAPTVTLLTDTPSVHEVATDLVREGTEATVVALGSDRTGIRRITINGFSGVTITSLAWCTSSNLLLFDAEIY